MNETAVRVVTAIVVTGSLFYYASGLFIYLFIFAVSTAGTELAAHKEAAACFTPPGRQKEKGALVKRKAKTSG